MTGTRYRWSVLAFALTLGIMLGGPSASAQDDLAAAGNGGTGAGNANGGNDDAVFQVCVSLNDDPAVCGPGSCVDEGGALVCSPNAATCDSIFEPEGCLVGGSNPGTCSTTNPNRADCTLLT